MPDAKRRFRSIGFAFITDEWSADPGEPASDITDLIHQLAASENRKLEESPERTTVYAAVLGNVRGPVVLCKIRREAPPSAADFFSELAEFVATVDRGDPPELFGPDYDEIGQLFGIDELMSGVTGDRPEWIDAWFNDVGGELTPREVDRGQGHPVVQGSGHPPRKEPSEHGVPDKGEAQRMKEAWGITGAPEARFGPQGGQGLVFDSGAFAKGWGSDDAQQSESSIQGGKSKTTQIMALEFAVIAFIAPVPVIKAVAGAFAIAFQGASIYHAIKQSDAAEREKQKHTPNPEDSGGGKHPFGPGLHLVGEVVYGSSDKRHPRVHFASERDAGNSWGWTQFGAPRAQPSILPDDSAMPDSSDENPQIWLGAQPSGTHASSDDYWIAGRMGWGWSRFGAPRAKAIDHS